MLNFVRISAPKVSVSLLVFNSENRGFPSSRFSTSVIPWKRRAGQKCKRRWTSRLIILWWKTQLLNGENRARNQVAANLANHKQLQDAGALLANTLVVIFANTCFVTAAQNTTINEVGFVSRATCTKTSEAGRHDCPHQDGVLLVEDN